MASLDVTRDLLLKLKVEEGYRNRAYKDTRGFVTFGYGHNLDAKPLTMEQFNLVLDDAKEGAERILYDDMMEHVIAIENRLPWLSNAPKNVQIAVFDMGFNMGVDGLMSFKNTLRHLKNREYDKAINGIKNSLYARQVPNRASRNISLIKSAL